MRVLVDCGATTDVLVQLHPEEHALLHQFADLCGGMEAMYRFLSKIVNDTTPHVSRGIRVRVDYVTRFLAGDKESGETGQGR